MANNIKARRIWRHARIVAMKLGSQSREGWIFDDGKIRICYSVEMLSIYGPNLHGERKLQYSRSNDQVDIRIYYSGPWEDTLEEYYAKCKNTA